MSVGRSMMNLYAVPLGADPFAIEARKIPEFMTWGEKLEKDTSIEAKVSVIMKFVPGESLRYHYHNVRGSSSFHIHHVSYHCVVLTNLRFASIVDGKVENSIEFSRMSNVVLAKKKGVLWDKVVVTRTDNTMTNFLISTEEAASFFVLVVNRVLESRKQKLLDEKQRKILRSIKTISQPQFVHDPSGHKSSMDYIYTSVAKHQRFELLPKEKIDLHCANLLRKVKLSTHPHLSTSNCIIKTNMRLIKIDEGKVVCAHLLSRITKIDVVPMHYLRHTRLHTHFFNGMVDTIKIGDVTAARFFARSIQNLILSRACESMEMNKKPVNKASVKFNFDDNDSFYIISEVRETQTLVLDHTVIATETGPVTHLILSNITGQKSQKWIEFEGRIIPLLVYEQLKKGVTGCPPEITDWVFNCRWKWNNYESCDAIAQVGHVLQNFFPTAKQRAPLLKTAYTPVSKADIQEGQYLTSGGGNGSFGSGASNTSNNSFINSSSGGSFDSKDDEDIRGPWIVTPSPNGNNPPFLFDEQSPQRELFLTIMGTCCQHPQCERDNIVPGSFVRLTSPQHDKHGKSFLNKMQQWQRATDFEMFVDEMLNPLIENLTKFREAQTEQNNDNNNSENGDKSTKTVVVELEYSVTFENIWGGDCYEAPFSIWDPKRDVYRFVIFGHYCSFGAVSPTVRMPIGRRELVGTVFSYPTSFELIWTYTPPKRLAMMLNPLFIWRPIHSDQNFAALGCVCSDGAMPDLTSVVCVHKSYLRVALTESIHSLCVVDDSEQENDDNKYVPLFNLSTNLLNTSDGSLSNSSFVFQGILRGSVKNAGEAEKSAPGLVILTQDKLLCFEGDKADGPHIEIQLTMTSTISRQDSESRFFQVDTHWFAARDVREKLQWTSHLETVLEALHPTKTVVPWTQNNSVWYVDYLRTFWVVSGHKAPTFELYRFKISAAVVAETERKMVTEGATLLVHASNELLSLINRRTREGDDNDRTVDENMLSNTFFQITELLQVINNFLALVQKQKLSVNSELHSQKMLDSKERVEQAKELIKRYIYRNVCRERLDLKERLRRLNSVWPIIDLFACTDQEVLSYSYNLPLTDDQKQTIEAVAESGPARPLRSLVTNVLRADIKKHVEELWVPMFPTKPAHPLEKESSFILPGFVVTEINDEEVYVETPKKKTTAEITTQVQNEVKFAFQFLAELVTSMHQIVPDLAVMCAEVIHMMIYSHLQEYIEPRMLSVQAAVKLIEWLGHYETKMRIIVKSDQTVLFYILGQLSRLVDGYMDAYIEAGQKACLQWVRQILEREEKGTPELETVKGKAEKFYHGHGPYDLFTNVNQVFDIAVHTHKFRGIALERQSEMLLQILIFYNQYQQRNLDRSFKVSSEIVTDQETPEIFFIAGRPFTHTWVLAQTNDVARYVELTEKFQETTREFLTASNKEMKMTAHTDEGFETLVNNFQDTGSNYVDLLKLFVDKYARLACARFFTEAWFADREAVWQQVSEDLDNCLSKFVDGVESDVYCRVLVKNAIKHCTTFYFLGFVENLKLVRAKCMLTESSANEFFERVKADKAAWANYWDEYNSLIEEDRFKIIQTELNSLDLLQVMYDCDEDFMQIHLEAVQKRFGRNPYITPTRLVSAVLTMKDVPKATIEALVAPWKANDTAAAGKTAGYDLIIKIEKGKNLAAKDSNGKSDPYCVVKLKDVQGAVLNSRQTPVLPETLDPVWNFTFADYTESLIAKFDAVVFEVWDKDFLTKDFMGQASLSFAQIQGQLLNKQWRTELTLEQKADKKDQVSGSIVVIITYGRKEQLEGLRAEIKQEQIKPPSPLAPTLSDGEKKGEKKSDKKSKFTFHFGSSTKSLEPAADKPKTDKMGAFFSAFKRDKTDKTDTRASVSEPHSVPVQAPIEVLVSESVSTGLSQASEGDDQAELAKIRQAAKESHIQQFKEARISSAAVPTKTAEPDSFFLERRK